MSVLVFDIETIPDIQSGRRIHKLGDDISDADVVRAMRHLQYQKSGNEFLPNHLHRVVAISVVYENVQEDKCAVNSLKSADAPEADLVATFFKIIEEREPTLVSWNGHGFDLPVLSYRALLYGIVAPKYWDTDSKDARFANYQNRFHKDKHLDMMDCLARYGFRGAGLDDICKMLGFPGKSGMSGDKVFDAWVDGGIDDIRAYCETDVVNTYLVYLRYLYIAAKIDREEYVRRYNRLVETLKNSGQQHLLEFAADMPAEPM